MILFSSLLTHILRAKLRKKNEMQKKIAIIFCISLLIVVGDDLSDERLDDAAVSLLHNLQAPLALSCLAAVEREALAGSGRRLRLAD